jgi:hypothetical protein
MASTCEGAWTSSAFTAATGAGSFFALAVAAGFLRALAAAAGLFELDRPPDLLRSAIAANDIAGPTYFSTSNRAGAHGVE